MSIEEYFHDFRIVHPSIDDLNLIFALESICFPPDEAAAISSIRLRIEQANPYFIVLKSKDNDIIGFVNATLSCYEDIHHESMTTHHQDGHFLVIHSVSIHPNYRRKGYGKLLLEKYILEISNFRHEVYEILLLSKAYLLSFYNSVGFTKVKMSTVTHGQDPWFELRYDLSSARNTQLQIDAFCLDKSSLFTGNPAAVVFAFHSDAMMLDIASENNLSETAFIRPIEGATNSFHIRWFTPTVEVGLCGHATLAAAHGLYETRRADDDKDIVFHTRESGQLVASRINDDMLGPGVVQLDFPASSVAEYSLSKEEISFLSEGFNISEEIFVTNMLFSGRTTYDLFIEMTPQVFASITTINYRSIAKVGGRGVIITCIGLKHSYNYPNLESTSRLRSDKYDFLSRFFGPCCGIDEDPVTGSAHCALAPYWSSKLAVKDSQQLIGFQASKRGGVVGVTLANDRVLLRGFAITTLTSVLSI